MAIGGVNGRDVWGMDAMAMRTCIMSLRSMALERKPLIMSSYSMDDTKASIVPLAMSFTTFSAWSASSSPLT